MTKVYRVLSHEFGVVRMYGTFSRYRGSKVCSMLIHEFLG